MYIIIFLKSSDKDKCRQRENNTDQNNNKEERIIGDFLSEIMQKRRWWINVDKNKKTNTNCYPRILYPAKIHSKN